MTNRTDPSITRVIGKRPEPPVSTAAIRIEKALTKWRDITDAIHDVMPAIGAVVFLVLLVMAFRPR